MSLFSLFIFINNLEPSHFRTPAAELCSCMPLHYLCCCSQSDILSSSKKLTVVFSVNEAVNPLSIDPNERVTPSGHETHNGDIHCESIGVSEIGVIPPPPMFSSPSPQSRLIIPPPTEHQNQFTARNHDHHEQHTKGQLPTVQIKDFRISHGIIQVT